MTSLTGRVSMSIDYLRNKYGEDSVGKVATFATLGAKAAIKDVGRALEVPLEDVAKLTELIPTIPGITLDDVLEQVPEFQALAERPENKELMDLSKSVEGMKRHVSCHALRARCFKRALDELRPPYLRIDMTKLRRSLKGKRLRMSVSLNSIPSAYGV